MRNLLASVGFGAGLGLAMMTAPVMAQTSGPAQMAPGRAPGTTAPAPAPAPVAPQAQAAPSAEAMEAAREMTKASGGEQAAAQALDMMRGQIIASLVNMTKQSPAEVTKAIDEVLMPELRARMPEMIDATAMVWARHLSVADLREMATFYRSPLGQRVSAATPRIAAESMGVAMNMGQEIAVEALAKQRDALRARGLKI